MLFRFIQYEKKSKIEVFYVHSRNVKTIVRHGR